MKTACSDAWKSIRCKCLGAGDRSLGGNWSDVRMTSNSKSNKDLISAEFIGFNEAME